MSVGNYISGAGHAALVVWMVAGWGMSAEPLPFEVTDVTVVSGEEFAALTQGVRPELPASEPVAPPVPDVPEDVPPPAVETPPEVAETPPPVEAPTLETPPEAPDLTLPETVVTDAPPDVPDTPQIITPPPSAEIGSSLRPVPRPAPRVAPETIVPPDADATVAPEVAEAATEQAEPVEEVVEPAEETTAPEAATDNIITEAEEPSFAPEISTRPASRPARPAPQEAVDPVTAALNAAGAGTPPTPPTQPTAPTPPTPGVGGGDISDGQKASILRQIGSCWSLGTVSTSASRTRITVRFSMNPGGVLDVNSIQMTGFDGGSQADADVIFRASRSALVRCQNDAGRTGYDVPAEQFQTRRDLQLVFDPSEMGRR